MIKTALTLLALFFATHASADCIPLLAKVQTWESSHPRNFTAATLLGRTPRSDAFYHIDAGPMAYTPPRIIEGPRPIHVPAVLDTNRLVEMRISGARPGMAMVRVKVHVSENPRIIIIGEDGAIWDQFTALGTCPNNSQANGRSRSTFAQWQLNLSYQQRPE